MATEPDLRREIAEERLRLTNAVADLRKELDQTAEKGRQIGVMVGTAIGTAIVVRTALRIGRRLRGD